jgi:hypothetical protein
MTALTGRAAVAILAVLFIASAADGQTLTLQGQLSSWFILADSQPSTSVAGIRYLPTLSIEQQLSDSRLIDGEVSVNVYGFGESRSWQGLDGEGNVKPYRGWVRFKSTRFEARAGLQKINFGSALLLRPLRWFDSVDPRDPLQLTDGVYAVLLRGYLPRNFTAWGWGLYGNDRLKGFELNPTRARTPEYGGRLQAPLFKGEIAGSLHHRQADLSKGLVIAAGSGDTHAQETRYGVDGKWDVGIGLWFEGEVVRQTRPRFEPTASQALTVGADYTFGLGNGLHVLAESFIQELPPAILGERASQRFAAATVSYPLGIIDSLSGIVTVDTRRGDVYRFVNWQRTFDRWQFYFMGFWNPRQLALVPLAESNAGRNPLSGKGIEILAVFNHGTSKAPSTARQP